LKKASKLALSSYLNNYHVKNGMLLYIWFVKESYVVFIFMHSCETILKLPIPICSIRSGCFSPIADNYDGKWITIFGLKLFIVALT